MCKVYDYYSLSLSFCSFCIEYYNFSVTYSSEKKNYNENEFEFKRHLTSTVLCVIVGSFVCDSVSLSGKVSTFFSNLLYFSSGQYILKIQGTNISKSWKNISIWNTKYYFATKLPIEKRNVLNSNHISCKIFVWTVHLTSENSPLVHNLLKISHGHSTHTVSGAELANLLDANSFHLHSMWKCNSPTLLNFSTSSLIEAQGLHALEYSFFLS